MWSFHLLGGGWVGVASQTINLWHAVACMHHGPAMNSNVHLVNLLSVYGSINLGLAGYNTHNRPLTMFIKQWIVCVALIAHLYTFTHMPCMLCCISGSNWRDVQAALNRLVSTKREAVTGDSQKGIHNSSICSVYVYIRVVNNGMYDVKEGIWNEWPLHKRNSVHISRA